MKILFLTPYPLKESPSQRFRFEQYFDILKDEGHRIVVQPFLNSNNWREFFKTGNPGRKVYTILQGIAKRIFILLRVPAFDFIFIHREAAPLGPPLFEWLIAKIFRKRIIYDFDDAIWLTDRKDESMLFRLLKWRNKVSAICRWSHRISCGNHFLCAFAQQHSTRVLFVPTTVDTQYRHNPALFPSPKKSKIVTIGWTGSHSTLKYLFEIESVLQRIETSYPFVRIRIIADRPVDLALNTLEFVKWRAETEIQDLLNFDIGLMPLPDDEWSKGKCGFKIIQYLSLEIPAVASPVGVNQSIVQHGVSGFLCRTDQEWYDALKSLIENKALRESFGKQGKLFIERNYSVNSTRSTFLSLFE